MSPGALTRGARRGLATALLIGGLAAPTPEPSHPSPATDVPHAISPERGWLEEGPGGPILVIASASNPFSRYYAEILRIEGLNVFTVRDIAALSPATLAGADAAILGEMPLSAAQVALLHRWVEAGGRLIAMRPDRQLSHLLGLDGGASTFADGYLRIHGATPAGAGLVHEPIQFHGPADRYTLRGASSLATLYQDAASPTESPAVTLHQVGHQGGQAAAFTYDLARSIISTRQGNPAWAGQDRDGLPPVRPNDLFYGAARHAARPDWIDPSKVGIPQADEQQRLLVNLILYMTRGRKPLPRFWYFPRGVAAVVVMTGDDHGRIRGGITARFERLRAVSPPDCAVEAWECVRGTAYVHPDTPLTGSEAAAWAAEGFEVALHVDTACADWTPASLEILVARQLQQWSAKYPSLPRPATSRTHCVAWSDYATAPQVEQAHGIRLDTNYYYWPPGWVAARPGYFTGSGLPMRFATEAGVLVDVYQVATQLTDESGQPYPTTIETLLDRAAGPEGYYAALTANMHTDQLVSPGADAILEVARARGIPVVSARQLLDWLGGREASAFGSLDWTGDTLRFTVSVPSGMAGLEAMLPRTGRGRLLTRLTRDRGPVTYAARSIKGVDYAVFEAVTGTYRATYAGDLQAWSPSARASALRIAARSE